MYLDKIDGHKVEKSSRSKIEFSKSKENNLSSLPTRFSLFPERKKRNAELTTKLFYTQILTNFRVKIQNVSIFWHFLKFKIFCEFFENFLRIAQNVAREFFNFGTSIKFLSYLN